MSLYLGKKVGSILMTGVVLVTMSGCAMNYTPEDDMSASTDITDFTLPKDCTYMDILKLVETCTEMDEVLEASSNSEYSMESLKKYLEDYKTARINLDYRTLNKTLFNLGLITLKAKAISAIKTSEVEFFEDKSITDLDIAATDSNGDQGVVIVKWKEQYNETVSGTIEVPYSSEGDLPILLLGEGNELFKIIGQAQYGKFNDSYDVDNAYGAILKFLCTSSKYTSGSDGHKMRFSYNDYMVDLVSTK